MSSSSIICRPTKDTYVRFLIILAAFWGFALYFFYDGSVGYRNKNAAYFAYQAFADGGRKASSMTADEWNAQLRDKTLLTSIPNATLISEGDPAILLDDKSHPLPKDAILFDTLPSEYRDHAAMSKSWNDVWTAYSSRMRYPLKPGDKPYDQATVDEQWIAGAVCILLGGVIVYFIVRTSRRVLALEGREVQAVGQRFSIDDISKIDLRQWGPGFKGVAYFTVLGKRLKIDGMTYGGFGSKDEAPAERFMQLLLAQYSGEIIEYAPEEGKDDSDSRSNDDHNDHNTDNDSSSDD